MRSYRALTEEERASVTGTRMQVVQARMGESLTSLSKRTHNAWDPTVTAVYNGMFPDHRFEGGELVKVARVVPYVPKERPIQSEREDKGS